MERILRKFESPEDAERATRQEYQRLTPDERVALTVRLQRAFYEADANAPRRLPRLLTVLERA
jgi:hypothetical protein